MKITKTNQNIESKNAGRKAASTNKRTELCNELCRLLGYQTWEIVKCPCTGDWAGYMDGVGSALVADFNDYDKALNLVLMGYVDSVTHQQLIPFGSTIAEAVPGECEPLPAIKEMCTRHIYKFEDGRWWHATDDFRSRKDASLYNWRPISLSRAKGYEPFVLSDEDIAWEQEYYDMAKAKMTA